MTRSEARVGALEAQRFSPTTRLRGESSTILSGSPDFRTPSGQPGSADATTASYDLRLVLDTSFDGQDLLRVRLRAGNAALLPFRTGVFNLNKSSGTLDSLRVDRAFYRFPVGERFVAHVGALVRNNDMLSFFPSAYRSEVLDSFNLAGTTGTYNKATGAGVGLSWRQPSVAGRPGFTLDGSLVANDGFADSSRGVSTSGSGLNGLTQLGYRGRNWGMAVAYRYGSQNSSLADANFRARVPDGAYSNSVSIAGYWSPQESGWLPSISLGYGYNTGTGGVRDSQSWMVGLQWDDLLWSGNAAGAAVGQPPFTGSGNKGVLLEAFLRLRLSDQIHLTQGLFYGSSVASNSGNDAWGGLIQATFKF